MIQFVALIIGDEILSGKRQDQHFPFVIKLLGRYGLRLSEVHYVGDNRQQLTELLRESMAQTERVLFSFGGIGNTPDDHTRQAAAAALGVPLTLSPAVKALLEQRFLKNPGDILTESRQQLGTFPQGSEHIPNPVNQIPGFSIRQHYFVPGFPQMAHPMLEWVMSTHYAALNPPQRCERSFILTGDNAYENTLLPIMSHIVSKYADLRLFSLPSLGSAGHRRQLELGVEGEPARVDMAMAEMSAAIHLLNGVNIEPV